MSNLTPMNRIESALSGEPLTPMTRAEAIISGEDLEPMTRLEWFLKNNSGGGSGEKRELAYGNMIFWINDGESLEQPLSDQNPIRAFTTLHSSGGSMEENTAVPVCVKMPPGFLNPDDETLMAFTSDCEDIWTSEQNFSRGMEGVFPRSYINYQGVIKEFSFIANTVISFSIPGPYVIASSKVQRLLPDDIDNPDKAYDNFNWPESYESMVNDSSVIKSISPDGMVFTIQCPSYRYVLVWLQIELNVSDGGVTPEPEHPFAN